MGCDQEEEIEERIRGATLINVTREMNSPIFGPKWPHRRYVLALMPIAIALGLALLLLGYFSVRGALFLTAIAVNSWYAVRDCAFRCMSTMYAR